MAALDIGSIEGNPAQCSSTVAFANAGAPELGAKVIRNENEALESELWLQPTESMIAKRLLAKIGTPMNCEVTVHLPMSSETKEKGKSSVIRPNSSNSMQKDATTDLGVALNMQNNDDDGEIDDVANFLLGME